MLIAIDERGTLRMLHSDVVDLREIGGACKRERASHVEPDDGTGGWYVDLAPVGGPLVRGFGNRGDALHYEARWIEENVL